MRIVIRVHGFLYVNLTLFLLKMVLYVQIRYSCIFGDGLILDSIDFFDSVGPLPVFVVLF